MAGEMGHKAACYQTQDAVFTVCNGQLGRYPKASVEQIAR